MWAAYDKETGAYLDNIESVVGCQSPGQFALHVVERHDRPIDMVAVIDVSGPEPWHLKLVDGTLVVDTDKAAEAYATAEATAMETAALESLKSRIRAGSATTAELCEFLQRIGAV